MKKIILFFVIINMMLVACSQEISHSKLYGTWKVVEFKANMPNLAPPYIVGAKKEALSSVYTFKKDNIFSVKSYSSPTGVNGNWNFSPSSKSLKMFHFENGEKTSDNYVITSLDESRMSWFQDFGGEYGSFKMILKRIK